MWNWNDDEEKKPEGACKESGCPFAQDGPTKCWKCSKTRKKGFSWTDAVAYLCTPILAAGFLLNVGSYSAETKYSPDPFVTLALIPAAIGILVAFYVVPQLIKKKREMYRNGQLKSHSELCSNPNCKVDLRSKTCPECGRLSGPFPGFFVGIFVCLGIPAAINGSCLLAPWPAKTNFTLTLAFASLFVSLITLCLLAYGLYNKNDG